MLISSVNVETDRYIVLHFLFKISSDGDNHSIAEGPKTIKPPQLQYYSTRRPGYPVLIVYLPMNNAFGNTRDRNVSGYLLLWWYNRIMLPWSIHFSKATEYLTSNFEVLQRISI